MDLNSNIMDSASEFALSTQGSWDEQEQDYDAQATKHVLDMMGQLQNLLYDDDKSTIRTNDLLDECQEWMLLFPHLRYFFKSQ